MSVAGVVGRGLAAGVVGTAAITFAEMNPFVIGGTGSAWA